MLSIIIVSYNVQYFLGQCLCSVQRAIEGLEAEVIVVDNNSTDGTVAALQTLFPEVKCIVNNTNEGYAKANNQGWKAAKGEYILFLNPDTLVGEDSLKNTLRVMKERPNTGAVGIRMIDGAGSFLPESKRGFPSPFVSFCKLSGLTALFPRSKVFARYYLGHIPEDTNSKVDVLAGAYMMVRRSVLEKTNGFDDAFFMYGEDVDLSYRIQQQGYDNYYFAECPIIHFKGESTRRDRRYVKMFYKAMSIFVKKHYQQQSWWFGILLQIAIWARAALSFITTLFSGKHAANTESDKAAYIIGNSEEANEVTKIFDKNAVRRKSLQHFTINEWNAGKNEWQQPGEIIFCPGSVSFKTIIEQMMHWRSKVSYKFYSEKCGCIISSNSKKSSGDVLIR